MQEQETLLADLEPLFEKQGIEILELGMSRKHGEVEVRVVVYSAKGTGTAECVKAHKIIRQRLFEVFGAEEPWIEVASPGIDRQLKSKREYAVFAGSTLRFLRTGESEWAKGRLIGLEGEVVSFETSGGIIAIPYADISKARLDSTPEGD